MMPMMKAELFTYGIVAEYETLADYIVNRSGDGICPMEEAVIDIDDPTEALAAVKRRLEELRTRK
jgi:hypothetical protein